jgi:hypothetical protein
MGPKLQLESIAAVKELQSSDFSSEVIDQLNQGITKYNSEKWAESAELFIIAWRYAENAFLSHLHKGLLLEKRSDSLEEDLSQGEPKIRAICWLRIYALHDAAIAFFAAPSSHSFFTADPYKAGKGGKYISKDTSFGLVMDEHITVTGEPGESENPEEPGAAAAQNFKSSMQAKSIARANKREMKGPGTPITEVLTIKDIIGHKLDCCKTHREAACHTALLCMRSLRMMERMMELSETNLLTMQLRVSSVERIKSNLLLIIDAATKDQWEKLRNQSWQQTWGQSMQRR